MSMPLRTVLARAATFFSAILVNSFEVAAVQERRTAAAGALGERALDAVALVDLHEVVADLGLLVLDEAGGEHGDTTLALVDAHLRALRTRC
jgi:hypothetical protein